MTPNDDLIFHWVRWAALWTCCLLLSCFLCPSTYVSLCIFWADVLVITDEISKIHQPGNKDPATTLMTRGRNKPKRLVFVTRCAKCSQKLVCYFIHRPMRSCCSGGVEGKAPSEAAEGSVKSGWVRKSLSVVFPSSQQLFHLSQVQNTLVNHFWNLTWHFFLRDILQSARRGFVSGARIVFNIHVLGLFL